MGRPPDGRSSISLELLLVLSLEESEIGRVVICVILNEERESELTNLGLTMQQQVRAASRISKIKSKGFGNASVGTRKKTTA